MAMDNGIRLLKWECNQDHRRRSLPPGLCDAKRRNSGRSKQSTLLSRHLVLDPPALLPNLDEKLKSSSIVRRCHSLIKDAFPQQSRHTYSLRLNDWHRYGWRAPQSNTNLVSSYQFSRLSKRNHWRQTAGDNSSMCLHSTAKQIDHEEKHCIKVPCHPHNKPAVQPMLRKPSLRTTHPVSVDDQLFSMIIKGKEMKPFFFLSDDCKTLQFYSTHYPLLLRKIRDNSPNGSAKLVTESDATNYHRETSSDLRRQEVALRISRMEEKLQSLEIDPDDEDVMKTELRHQCFNPTKWQWNATRY